MTVAQKTEQTFSPPYIPWKTFDNYIAGLKAIATVPHTLDGSVKPRTMAGGLWRQLLSAMKFLDLIGDDNATSDGLEALRKAHGTKEWPQAVKEYVLPAYDDIIGELPLENATAAQLAKQFKEGTESQDQVLKKCIRFYIHSLRESGVKHSSHFGVRKESSGASKRGPRKSRKEDEKSAPAAPAAKPENTNAPAADKTPDGMIDILIPMGAQNGLIRIPRKITQDQYAIFEAMAKAVQVMAAQNGPVAAK